MKSEFKKKKTEEKLLLNRSLYLHLLYLSLQKYKIKNEKINIIFIKQGSLNKIITNNILNPLIKFNLKIHTLIHLFINLQVSSTRK